MPLAVQVPSMTSDNRLSKVPEVTLGFWIIKILCTTLGETGGDAVTMSMNLGYLLYWTTIIATTAIGTTMADFSDRSLGIGYAGGSLTLLGLLLSSLGLWYWSLGSVSVNTVSTPKVEAFYWVTIMFSQTLGTALGDWTADTAGIGYLGGAALFSLLLVVVAACHFWTKISTTFLFWAAFILTRPLGAVVGDLLDKPLEHGGLNLSRYSASATLIMLIIICILIFPQRAGQRPEH